MFRKLAFVATTVSCVLISTACATSRGATDSPTSAPTNLATPVAFTNCDVPLQFTTRPQRIVTMNDHVTEVLLELGVGDRIVGMGYAAAKPMPKYAEQWQRIPHLADKYPTAEQLVDASPDFVVAGMRSAFSEKEGRSRDALTQKGMKTFLFSEYCGTGLADISVLERDYRQLGQALGAEPAAEKLIASIRGDLAQIRTDIIRDQQPVPTFVYDSGEQQALTVGGRGIGQLILDSAGAKNVFPEGEKPYSQAPWETIAERAPQVIVVLDYGDNTAQQKIDFLKAHPLMKGTPAVRDNRFVVVPLDDFFESPRLVGSARTIAEALHGGKR